MSACLLDTLHDARARWLRGDANAWAHYTACCLRFEAELRGAQHDGLSDPPPAVPSRPEGWRTKRRRHGRPAARHRSTCGGA